MAQVVKTMTFLLALVKWVGFKSLSLSAFT